ncbi:hypothetical protein EYF80_020023 [Liparis tanakae]|uniref:Uncharacterized protein n=1 Tax=Liparis tanakae TaxID=230148 RepID=A0A4Z2HW28_9TELE|nr:hypothetical protein EYF80_020023 [Liparis tanakae]
MLSFLLRVSVLRCSSMEHMLNTCCITASCRRSSRPWKQREAKGHRRTCRVLRRREPLPSTTLDVILHSFTQETLSVGPQVGQGLLIQLQLFLHLHCVPVKSEEEPVRLVVYHLSQQAQGKSLLPFCPEHLGLFQLP